MDLFSISFIFHLVGLALGAGGAFASDFLFLASLRDKKISATELRLLKTVGVAIWLGISISVVSGFSLLWLADFALLSSAAFQMKLTIIGVIILNGLVLHLKHYPFMKSYFVNEEPMDKKYVARKMDAVAITGALSAPSWLSVIILGFLRVLPYSYLTILAVYVFIILGAAATMLAARRVFFPLK